MRGVGGQTPAWGECALRIIPASGPAQQKLPVRVQVLALKDTRGQMQKPRPQAKSTLAEITEPSNKARGSNPNLKSLCFPGTELEVGWKVI